MGNVLPNIFFFCLGLAKIVFQLDAVKFAIELILLKQRPKFRLHVLFWVSRLRYKEQGNLVFIGYDSQVLLNEINVSIIIQEHHIGDFTSLYIGQLALYIGAFFFLTANRMK